MKPGRACTHTRGSVSGSSVLAQLRLSRLWLSGLLLIGLLLASTLPGCTANSDVATDSGLAGDTSGGTITVFAASSLAPVIDELTQAFASDIRVLFSLAGSSTLREQLLAGAPADVFIPADIEHLEAVSKERPLAGPAVVVLKNRLALAVPAGNPAQVTGLADLSRPELLVGLCVEPVPCGALARQALAKAGITPEIDTEAPNVSALITQLAAGELDAGIVYFTNTLSADIEEVAWAGPVATYAAGVIAGSPNVAAAQVFLEFLTTPIAQAIFERGGFVLP